MTRFKLGPKTAISAALAGLLLLSGVAWQSALAARMDWPVAPRPAAAGSLSYYFISGRTFTPDAGGITPYFDQADGCVNQMPLLVHMLAPVHLPQASTVLSITLFTNDTVITTTFSTAYFNQNDGQGGASHLLSADSDSGVAGYQHHDNTMGSPVTIDNQSYSYEVEWRKVPQEADTDSPFLSLCGVRLAYHAPVGVTFLPAVEK